MEFVLSDSCYTLLQLLLRCSKYWTALIVMVERVTTNPIRPLFDRHTIATQVAEKILVDNPPKSNCPLELRQENQMNIIRKLTMI